jgi:hypothetical protein
LLIEPHSLRKVRLMVISEIRMVVAVCHIRASSVFALHRD